MKNSSGGKVSMSTASLITTWKVRDVVPVPDQFPTSLPVLVVDDDPTCLIFLEKMLRNRSYDVTKCNRIKTALSKLRENRNGFDIITSNVYMPDMDGFKLLEHIGLDIDMPIINNKDETEDKDDTSTLKTSRVVWSVELHQQFVASVNQLGIDNAREHLKSFLLICASFSEKGCNIPK
ncbi:hypothetical protein ES319_D11G238800v1 [Gossypium barbadense]|uniref:Response regulatory domain-containing protein n=2 Tax=Gossypium TaxID=3633 RepID=A0A5J5PHN3_GOSBA|nr:hypothetical protein ES319_D11G238800v1 [Gossypium barbadense]TYG46382.1 hypothetical protein ES288_D11G252300v1 [Gossypium darwinii]